jgi:predicted transcriptional regulator
MDDQLESLEKKQKEIAKNYEKLLQNIKDRIEVIKMNAETTDNDLN